MTDNNSISTSIESQAQTVPERMSAIDQENLDFQAIIDKILAQPDLRDQLGDLLPAMRESLLDSARSGSKPFLDIVRDYNQRHPEDLILIPSDYVTDAREAAEPDWIVPGIAIRNNTTLLYGESGVGKTIFYLHMTDALMHGASFLGIQCSRCKPLIVCQDEDLSILKDQWHKMGKTGVLPAAKRDVVWDKKGFNEDFTLTLKAYRPDVVFVDSYTSLGIPDITRPESGLVFDALNKIARDQHCSIILIHHTNLSKEPMGSSLHKAKVSSMLSMLKSDENHIVITQEKVRGSHFEPIVVRFDRLNLQMEREQGSLREQVWRLLNDADPGESQETVVDEILARFPERNVATTRRYVREHRQAAGRT